MLRKLRTFALSLSFASTVWWLLRAGQIVTLRGYLVNVSGRDGFHWDTSLQRGDTGNGACEVFYVESAGVEDGVS